ncbi:GyrI-like domain-containing protein [Streptacidiphilus sp. N1-10]|uniref:GyrI-like domain-containing protein n=1 Tax=Streptacidiphilus jeojiensis TaxID=3229225 RepID=A0ABV6XJX0_9ACTN
MTTTPAAHEPPRIVERPAQPYAAVRSTVTMANVGTIAHRIPEVFARLGALGIAPAGPPFLKYNVIDMEGELEIEAGVPVAEPVPASGDLLPGVLPAGRYATFTHVGSPDQLVGANALLLDWAAAAGLRWDTTPGEEGERWGCRLESYRTDPREQPDTTKWETDLFFRLADG